MIGTHPAHPEALEGSSGCPQPWLLLRTSPHTPLILREPQHERPIPAIPFSFTRDSHPPAHPEALEGSSEHYQPWPLLRTFPTPRSYFECLSTSGPSQPFPSFTRDPTHPAHPEALEGSSEHYQPWPLLRTSPHTPLILREPQHERPIPAIPFSFTRDSHPHRSP